MRAPTQVPGGLIDRIRAVGRKQQRMLLSQGETRPGVSHGPCYGPSLAFRACFDLLTRNTWMPGPIVPSHADPRLSNRMER